MKVADADETIRTRFGLPKEIAGAVVVEVEPGSVASSLGLKPGDVIESVDGKPVKDGRELQDAMSGIKWGDRKTREDGAVRRAVRGSRRRAK